MQFIVWQSMLPGSSDNTMKISQHSTASRDAGADSKLPAAKQQLPAPGDMSGQ